MLKERTAPLNRERGDLFEYGVAWWISHHYHIPCETFRKDMVVHQVLDLVKKMDNREIHDKIWFDHAKRSAYTIINHAKKMGYIPIDHTLTGVYLTSYPGEIAKLIGEPDPNNTSDIVIAHRDTHWNKFYLGVSLKYIGSKGANYKNPGLTTLATLSNSNLGVHWYKHQRYMEELGYTGTINERHKQYKEDKTSDFRGLQRAKEAERSALEAKTEECKVMWEGFNKMSSEALTSIVEYLVNPPTTIPVLHAVGIQDDKYRGDFWCNVQEQSEKFRIGISKFERLHADIPPAGTVVRIYGRTKDGQDKTVVAINIRARSGPHQALQATTTADFLEDTKPNRPYKAKIQKIRKLMREKHEQVDKAA